MLKLLRKYNKWILVIGGTLLMMAFLVPQAISQFGSNPGSVVIARIDGKPVRAGDENHAQLELHALKALSNGLILELLGLQDKDTTWWMLLKSEAREGGFIAEASDGPAWIPDLARTFAEIAMDQVDRFGLGWRNPQNASLFAQIYQQGTPQELYSKTLANWESHMQQGREVAAAESRLTVKDVDLALAEARGIVRMRAAYYGAARMSDRLSATIARRRLDSAYTDLLAIPAQKFADTIPAPDDAALQAHVDRFKTVRPGEGEFGIGYLLPARLKLEWMTLDARAILDAIPADPVEVNKRFLQNRETYRGEFAAERARVEADYKNEKLNQVLTEAHRVIQAQVLQATRRLESDGRYRKVPADWESQRPRFERIAKEVVDQVQRGTGVTIPLPSVTVRDRWTTGPDLASLPGIAGATFQSGNSQFPLARVLMSVRELLAPGADSPVPLQVGVPLTETYFTGPGGSRTYVTVLGARGESEPESIEEVRESATEDYKNLKAYESLVARMPEWKSLAVSGSLEAVRDAVFPPPPEPPGGGPMPPDERPGISLHARVTRERVFQGEGDARSFQLADTEAVRTAIMTAADTLDPLADPATLPVERATVASGSPQRLAVVIGRITGLAPLTREEIRMAGMGLVANLQRDELAEALRGGSNPFSLERLKQRHGYTEEAGRRRSSEPEPAEPVAPGI
jgi:hypothetical protein